jgi:hypothetical protein
MSRSPHCTFGFDGAQLEVKMPWQGAPITGSPITASPWPILAVLQAMWDAFRDGLAALRQYESLRSKGIPHDTALREAIGIGITRSDRTRGVVKPLCFAGKA